jgi:glycosyltransferase involved in cell wall biosynthesis
MGSSVHPFAAIAAERLARRKKVPFIFEVRDLWPQTLIDMGRLRSTNPLSICMRMIEKWLYKRADRIITLLPYAGNYIEPLGIDPQKISWLPNGVDLSKFPEPPPSNDREEFVLMYFGAHGRANGLENVLNAMNQIKSHLLPKIVRLRLIGDGPQKPRLISLANKLSLNNVSFEAPVPKKAVPSLASEADGFIFNLINVPVFRYGISSNKLFEFMAAGLPIIFCCNASNNPIEDAEAGLTVVPDDPIALAKAIEELVSIPHEKRCQMGQRARRYVELNHDFNSLAEKLAGLLDRLS